MSRNKYFNLFGNDEDDDYTSKKGKKKSKWDDDWYSNKNNNYDRSYGGNGGNSYGNYSGRYGGGDYSYIYSNKNTNSVIKQGISYYTANNMNDANVMHKMLESKDFISIDLDTILGGLPYSMGFFIALQGIIHNAMNNGPGRTSQFNNSNNLSKGTIGYLHKIGVDQKTIDEVRNNLQDNAYPYNFQVLDKIYKNGLINQGSKKETGKVYINNILSLMINDLEKCISGEFASDSGFTGQNSRYMECAKSALNVMYYVFVVFNKFIEKDDVEMFGQDYFKNFNKEEVDYQIKEDNQWWFNIMSNTDNYIMKMITKNSDTSSKIVANNMTQAVCKSIYQYVSKKLEVDPNYNPEDFKNDCGGGGGQGSGEGEQQEGEGEGQGEGQQNSGGQGGQGSGKGQMDKDFQDQLQANAEQAMDQSRDEIKDKNSAMNMLGVDPEKATEQELQDVDEIIKEINEVRLDKNDVERFVKQSIKNFNSSFRGQKHIMEESFLDADEVDDLRDLHLLIDLSLIDDMAVNVNRYSMKYNLYVDCSGSMGSKVTMAESARGKKDSELKRITLAKILAYKMNKMNLINDVYAFEHHVHTTPVKNIIKQLHAGGGTCIDNVMNHINQQQIPSVILSDGDDTIHQDSDHAYVFTISSTCGGPTMNKLAASGRAIHFENGQFINYELDSSGNAWVDRRKVKY